MTRAEELRSRIGSSSLVCSATGCLVSHLRSRERCMYHGQIQPALIQPGNPTDAGTFCPCLSRLLSRAVRHGPGSQPAPPGLDLPFQLRGYNTYRKHTANSWRKFSFKDNITAAIRGTKNHGMMLMMICGTPKCSHPGWEWEAPDRRG